jgi:predicted CXXCH cytochrome family protein
MATKKWYGSLPDDCNICHNPITTDFVDGATVWGPWAILCLPCHRAKGRGLGTGLGQHYIKTGDGWVKVAG